MSDDFCTTMLDTGPQVGKVLLEIFGEALKEGNINQIMYVPTEANIPITEATRIRQAGVE